MITAKLYQKAGEACLPLLLKLGDWVLKNAILTEPEVRVETQGRHSARRRTDKRKHDFVDYSYSAFLRQESCLTNLLNLSIILLEVAQIK